MDLQSMNQTSLTIALIIPMYNAANDIPLLMPAIMQQTLKPDSILVIDSSSSDDTVALLAAYPVRIHQIPKQQFDHGGTRKLATQIGDADIYIYLTQDAYPANPHAFQEIVNRLCASENIGCAFGRQIPKAEATPLSKHLRIFNYPQENYVRHYTDRDLYGIKTCFNSDSFAAYKKQALDAVGNFPEHLMTAEDAYVAARMLMQGYAVAYAANACVHHSHNFSLRDEFHRYFSIGVFHGSERWILDNFRSATGEGWRFVKSELNYLISNGHGLWLPRAMMSTLIKFIGYQFGLRERSVPYFIKKHLGINKAFWKKVKTVTA
jgi:rhamnosyltransferase